MGLPNADAALVEENKVVGYLLNLMHPEGAGKARYFNELGYSRANWQYLAAALTEVGKSGQIEQRVESRYGQKYIIDGEIISPTDKVARLRTVWIIETQSTVPRLVTAYPREPF